MSVPLSYTEETLALWLHTILGPVAKCFGWTVEIGSYAEIVNDALLDYGVNDISTITDLNSVTKLRVLARRQAWRAAVEHSAADFAFSADGGSYSRDQIQGMCEKALALANADALTFDPNYKIGVDRTIHIHDPYAQVDEDRRTVP